MYLVPQSEIKIGNMRFFGGNTGINAVEIDTSVKKLVSTAKITLPANFKNSEGKKITELMHVGDKAEIRLGYNGKHLLQEKSRAEVRRILDNAEQYKALKANPDYKDVDFDWKTGGLKATHKDHNFDKVGGQYELEAQRAGFKAGNKVIFGSEKGGVIGQKYIEGLWNDHSFEIGSSLGTGKNNIKGILNHCKDKEAEVAVIHFPKPELYSFERLKNGIKRYNGQTDYRFKEIIYIVDGKVNSYK